MGPLYAVLGFLSPGNATGIPIDLEAWFSQLLRYPSVYPVRFALAIGLLLGVVGLLFHLLSTGGEPKEAPHWWMRDAPSAGKRGGIVVTLLCVAGIVLGLLYAHVTQSTESTRNDIAGQASIGRVRGIVWADPTARVYHCRGSAGYGKTNSGKYMSLEQAKEEGYQPASGKPCFADQRFARGASKH